jgi:hypothetical protein
MPTISVDIAFGNSAAHSSGSKNSEAIRLAKIDCKNYLRI